MCEKKGMQRSSPIPDDLWRISKFHRNLPTLSRDNASYDDSLSRELTLSERFSVIIDIHDPFNLFFLFFIYDHTTEITRRNHMIVACALTSRAKITKNINFREAAILITLIILKIIHLTQVTIFSEKNRKKI